MTIGDLKLKYTKKCFLLLPVMLVMFLFFCRVDPLEEVNQEPEVREVWQEWIQENNNPIQSLSSDDFSDLSFLKDLLKGKKIVAMGELSHGILEQNKLRVRLMKFLHQELGFTVFAFESALFECFFMNEKLEENSVRDSIKDSLHSFWHTSDLIDLFEYVKETRGTDNPITISGFDNMFTGRLMKTRPEFFKKILEFVNPVFAKRIYDLELKLVSFDYNSQLEYMRENLSDLSEIYQRCISIIDRHYSKLVDSYGKTQIELAKRVAQGTLALVNQRNSIKISTSLGEAGSRDFQMADNIKWLSEELYPGQKIVVWSHNSHNLKNCKEVKNGIGYKIYPVMMGDLLNYFFPNQYYNMICLSYEGRIRVSGTKIEVLSYTADECIEAICNSSHRDICFIDLSRAVYSEGNSWMFEEIGQTYWHRDGNYSFFYIPRDQFDGILFIKKVTIPDFF